jgi:hypothetical protein
MEQYPYAIRSVYLNTIIQYLDCQSPMPNCNSSIFHTPDCHISDIFRSSLDVLKSKVADICVKTKFESLGSIRMDGETFSFRTVVLTRIPIYRQTTFEAERESVL